jgi:hypothetical protein
MVLIDDKLLSAKPDPEDTISRVCDTPRRIGVKANARQ